MYVLGVRPAKDQCPQFHQQQAPFLVNMYASWHELRSAHPMYTCVCTYINVPTYE